jgi:hypothetical protein
MNQAKKEDEKKITANPNYKNGIVITASNISVEKAFLVLGDDVNIPDNNTIRVNQKVWLRLVTSGWKLKDSLIYLSGRETVEASNGEIILDNKDLFKDPEKGISGGSSQTIGISLLVSDPRKKNEHFKVSFKIKDEMEPRNAIEGYYDLYVR